MKVRNPNTSKADEPKLGHVPAHKNNPEMKDYAYPQKFPKASKAVANLNRRPNAKK